MRATPATDVATDHSPAGCGFASSNGSAILSASPRPWKVHRTGDKLSITDARGKFVFRKVVSTLRGGVPEYERLLADFNAIVEAVNSHWPNGGSEPRFRERS